MEKRANYLVLMFDSGKDYRRRFVQSHEQAVSLAKSWRDEEVCKTTERLGGRGGINVREISDGEYELEPYFNNADLLGRKAHGCYQIRIL